MTVIEYLNQVKDIDLRIRSLEGELADSCSEDDAEYAEELRSRIEENLAICKELRLKIREEIQHLGDNRSCVLLTEYYIRGRSWEDVAAALDKKSVKHVREGMHQRALNLFSEKYSKIFSEI